MQDCCHPADQWHGAQAKVLRGAGGRRPCRYAPVRARPTVSSARGPLLWPLLLSLRGAHRLGFPWPSVRDRACVAGRLVSPPPSLHTHPCTFQFALGAENWMTWLRSSFTKCWSPRSTACVVPRTRQWQWQWLLHYSSLSPPSTPPPPPYPCLGHGVLFFNGEAFHG